ncbi:MAG TPA: GNAT family N-acetyltransferase [Actinomycetota bacterium]|nr:GNAT family N-acetyltransferase [Actinomycetota bacterium]
MPEISTERLLLRHFRADDLGPHREAVDDDPAVTWHHKRWSLAESLRRWAERLEQWERGGFGMWIVEERATGAVIGHCGLQPMDDSDDVELGYYLGRSSWGRGYATECAEASLRFGFERVKLPRIVAVTRVRNTASQHVLEKLGMTFEGKATAYGFPVRRYGIDRATWRARQRSAPSS